VASLWTVTASDEKQVDSPPVTIDPPSAIDSRAFGITASGDIVGLYVTPDSKTHGFFLTGGVYTSIDVPGAVRTNAVGITELRGAHGDDQNDQRDGAPKRLAIVGRYDTTNPANPAATIGHGYLLSGGGLATIDHPDATTFTVTSGINSSGQIVGRYMSKIDNRLHGFLLEDGIFTTVDYPGAMATYGIAINERGDIAGYYADASAVSHGFVRHDGVFTTIDPPGALSTGLNAGILGINSHEVVGLYRAKGATLPCGCDGTRGFVYSLGSGSYTTYAVPDSLGTGFTGVNGRGDIVGLFPDKAGRLHGLLLLRGGDQ